MKRKIIRFIKYCLRTRPAAIIEIVRARIVKAHEEEIFLHNQHLIAEIEKLDIEYELVQNKKLDEYVRKSDILSLIKAGGGE